MSLSKVQEKVNKWSNWRKEECIKKLNNLADTIEREYAQTRSNKIFGTSVAIAGGALAATGVALSFFTLGTSLLLTIPGAFIGAAGAATNIVADIKASPSMKRVTDECKSVLEEDKAMIIEIMKGFKEVSTQVDMDEKSFWQTVLYYFPYGKLVWKGLTPTKLQAQLTYTALKGGQVAQEFGEVAFSSMSQLGKVIKVGFFAVSVFFVFFDSWSLASLIKDTDPPELATKIRNAAKELAPPKAAEVQRAFKELGKKLQ